MGFDVYGIAPKSDVGKHFRTSVWGWRPLWGYCVTVAPDIAGKVENAQYNDGGGLEATDALALGEALASSVASGTAAAVAKELRDTLSELPDEVCVYCEGTGTRADVVIVDGCNVCHGTGKVRPLVTRYWLDVGRVEEFATFCCASGGFEIW